MTTKQIHKLITKQNELAAAIVNNEKQLVESLNNMRLTRKLYWSYTAPIAKGYYFFRNIEPNSGKDDLGRIYIMHHGFSTENMPYVGEGKYSNVSLSSMKKERYQFAGPIDMPLEDPLPDNQVNGIELTLRKVTLNN